LELSADPALVSARAACASARCPHRRDRSTAGLNWAGASFVQDASGGSPLSLMTRNLPECWALESFVESGGRVAGEDRKCVATAERKV
jgi:hypothetical protein